LLLGLGELAERDFQPADPGREVLGVCSGPDLHGPGCQGPLADLDAALRQLGVAIPTLGPRTAHAVPAEARVTQPGR